jgi:hypothetical protein
MRLVKEKMAKIRNLYFNPEVQRPQRVALVGIADKQAIRAILGSWPAAGSHGFNALNWRTTRKIVKAMMRKLRAAGNRPREIEENPSGGTSVFRRRNTRVIFNMILGGQAKPPGQIVAADHFLSCWSSEEIDWSKSCCL